MKPFNGWFFKEWLLWLDVWVWRIFHMLLGLKSIPIPHSRTMFYLGPFISIQDLTAFIFKSGEELTRQVRSVTQRYAMFVNGPPFISFRYVSASLLDWFGLLDVVLLCSNCSSIQSSRWMWPIHFAPQRQRSVCRWHSGCLLLSPRARCDEVSRGTVLRLQGLMMTDVQ